MPQSPMPGSWQKESKPHKFCPGCGQALALKILGQTIDEMQLQEKMVYATDIGCSLLSWDMFNVDTIQTHHGRTIPLCAGFKLAKPESVIVGLVGDGGGYAIGAQHLLNSAMRNDRITIILINNANYAMTGGQMAPTTMLEQFSETTPEGRKISSGSPFKGPEMLAEITADTAFVGRCISTDGAATKEMFKKAIQNQIDGRGFSFVEVVSMCPVNWHTDAKETLEFANNMTKVYPLGVIKCPPELS